MKHLHPARAAAQKAYDRSSEKWKNAGTDEALAVALKEHEANRDALIEMERIHPTVSELRRA